MNLAAPQDTQQRGFLAAPVLAVLVSLILTAGAVFAAETRATLVVSAAISLRPALARYAAEFESRERGVVRVQLNTGGSGLLAQQIRRGAPAAVFISASSRELDRLDREGRLISPSRRVIAANQLVLIAPAGTPAPTAMTKLTDERLRRIAVANPRTAPLGHYTGQALRSVDLADALADRLIFGENARQVLDWVARGEADAGIVYRTDAALLPDRVHIGAAIPLSAHGPVRYEAAVVAQARHADAAARFVDGLGAGWGQRILGEAGFTVPTPGTRADSPQ